jgi:hypothetical protein
MGNLAAETAGRRAWPPPLCALATDLAIQYRAGWSYQRRRVNDTYAITVA